MIGGFLLVIVVINFVTTLLYILFSVEEHDYSYTPFWRMVWNQLPLNLAGKIIVCSVIGVVFLPSDICCFVILVLIRLIRHIGYAFWWVFAIDREDVLHRWSDFWNDRSAYFKYWEEGSFDY